MGYEILFEDEEEIQYELEGIYMDNELKFDLKTKNSIKRILNRRKSRNFNARTTSNK